MDWTTAWPIDESWRRGLKKARSLLTHPDAFVREATRIWHEEGMQSALQALRVACSSTQTSDKAGRPVELSLYGIPFAVSFDSADVSVPRQFRLHRHAAKTLEQRVAFTAQRMITSQTSGVEVQMDPICRCVEDVALLTPSEIFRYTNRIAPFALNMADDAAELVQARRGDEVGSKLTVGRAAAGVYLMIVRVITARNTRLAPPACQQASRELGQMLQGLFATANKAPRIDVMLAQPLLWAIATAVYEKLEHAARWESAAAGRSYDISFDTSADASVWRATGFFSEEGSIHEDEFTLDFDLSWGLTQRRDLVDAGPYRLFSASRRQTVTEVSGGALH